MFIQFLYDDSNLLVSNTINTEFVTYLTEISFV